MTSELKREFFPGFAPEAEAALLTYDWPGNVRELKNAVERSVYRSPAPDEPIDRIIFDPFASPYGALRPLSSAPAYDDEAEPEAPPQTNGGTRRPRNGASLPLDFRAAVASFEQATLEQALVEAKYKQTAAAKLLGLSYHQFRGLLKKHGLTAVQSSSAEA